MQPSRRTLATLSLALVALAAPLVSTTPAAGARPMRDQAAAVTTVLDWQLIAFRTIFSENPTPLPVGTLHMGLTALAVHDAAQLAVQRGRNSARAAVATAAHGVLLHYFPASKANLAADLIASRAGDGYGDPTVAYTLDPATPGIWAPAAVSRSRSSPCRWPRRR